MASFDSGFRDVDSPKNPALLLWNRVYSSGPDPWHVGGEGPTPALDGPRILRECTDAMANCIM